MCFHTVFYSHELFSDEFTEIIALNVDLSNETKVMSEEVVREWVRFLICGQKMSMKKREVADPLWSQMN